MIDAIKRLNKEVRERVKWLTGSIFTDAQLGSRGTKGPLERNVGQHAQAPLLEDPLNPNARTVAREALRARPLLTSDEEVDLVFGEDIKKTLLVSSEGLVSNGVDRKEIIKTTVVLTATGLFVNPLKIAAVCSTCQKFVTAEELKRCSVCSLAICLLHGRMLPNGVDVLCPACFQEWDYHRDAWMEMDAQRRRP